MDIPVAELGADRRPSIMRLVAALRRALPPDFPRWLSLPVCLLFARHLRFDAADPAWPDRDRLILAPTLNPLGTALSALVGLPENFCLGLGPALELSVGVALAERKLAGRFGRSLVDHRVWAFGTGADFSSGSVLEAVQLAGAARLGRLTAFIPAPAEDSPNLASCGLAAFTAAGWAVRRVNEAEAGEVAAAISAALRSQKPTLIACLPQAPEAEHLGELSGEQGAASWATTGRRVAAVRRAWLKRLARHASRGDYDSAVSGKLAPGWHNAIMEPGTVLPSGQATISTASTLCRSLARLAASMPEFVILQGESVLRPDGGEAAAQPHAQGSHAQGSHAQGVALAMAGMALHGGVIPAGVHALAEAESVGPGLRAAAAAGVRIVHCLVEPASPCPVGGQRAALRAMRNVFVFRPADGTEALECAELALRRMSGPSVLLLSDLPVPLLAPRPTRTRCAKGGYVLCEAPAPRAVTLIAGGPELHEAMLARGILAEAGVAAAVVSLPCWEYFVSQEPVWQDAVLGDAPRVGIEAGGGFGWERFLGPGGLFIGPDRLGETVFAAPMAHRIADLVLRHLEVRSPQAPKAK